MATDTRARIIEAAHTLFYRDGFHRIGLDPILDAVGVTKTTFYNHFESKDDLVLAVLEWHDKWWRETFVGLLRKHGGDTPLGQLRSVGEAIDEVISAEGFNGCIFVNVAVEFPLSHDPAHLAAAAHKRAMEDLLREIAGYAGAPDAGALAKELALVLEGAYVTRKVTGDAETAAIARRVIDGVLERHFGAGAVLE